MSCSLSPSSITGTTQAAIRFRHQKIKIIKCCFVVFIAQQNLVGLNYVINAYRAKPQFFIDSLLLDHKVYICFSRLPLAHL